MHKMEYFALALIGLLLMLSLLRENYIQYRIEGIASDFCIPRARDIEGVYWGGNSFVEKSFAFRACNLEMLTGDTHCLFPKAVLSGVVSPKHAYRTQVWQEIPDNTPFKQWATDENSQLASFHDGAVVVSSNTIIRSYGWDVWQKATPLKPDEKVFLGNNDYLLVSCSNLPKRAQNKSYVCSRSVLMADYSLEYGFETDEKAPEKLSVEQMDEQVAKVLNSWKCPK